MAIQARCASPPERVATVRSRSSVSPACAMTSATIPRSVGLSGWNQGRWGERPSPTSSVTVMSAGVSRVCPSIPTSRAIDRRDMARVLCPATQTSPVEGTVRVTAFRMVDLPEPLGPMIEVTVPGATSRLTPWTTGVPS